MEQINICVFLVHFQHLLDLGILKAIEAVLVSAKYIKLLDMVQSCALLQSLDDYSTKTAAIDVFMFILENSPSSVREFVIVESSTTEDVCRFGLLQNRCSNFTKMLYFQYIFRTIC